MRFGSLFSGIEAASAAWLPLGWACAWVAEIDPFACAVLRHHYPDVPNLGDVNRIDWHAVEPVDLVVFGSPCQSFSVAGKRLGLDDPRGNMALVGLRLIGRIRPRWVVWENVPGVLSSDGGRDFGAFLGLLGELGYGFAYRVLDAQHAGVPQRRRRVFVVGCLGDWRGAAAVLFEPESLRGDPAPRREAGEDAPAGAGDGPVGSVRCQPWSDHAGDESRLIAFSAKDHGADHGDTAPTLRAGGHSASHANAGVMPAVLLPNHAPPMQSPARPTPTDAGYSTAIAFQANAGRDFTADEDRSPPLRSDELGGGGRVAIAHALRADGFDASEDGTGRGTPLVAVPIQSVQAVREKKQNGIGIGQDGDPMFTQTGRDQHAVMTLAIRGRGDSHDLEYREDGIANAVLTPNGGRAGIGVGAVAFHENQRAETYLGDIAGSLNSGGGKPGQGYPAIAIQYAEQLGREKRQNGMGIADENDPMFTLERRQVHGIVIPMSVRRLTPVECERLQGFPDGYTDIPYRGKPAADGPRYRAIGNSMAVPVVAWLGRRIQQFTEQEATDAE